MHSLFEAVVGQPTQTPRHFWLVLDIPDGGKEDERTQKILGGLSHGQLDGVRGISETKLILTDWWLMCRNAAIMMDANKVISLNDIEQVAYHDPEALCANNMKALGRLFNKEADTKGNRYGLMLNVMQYFLSAYKKDHNKDWYTLDYYGAANTIAALWQDNSVEINTTNDLAAFIYNGLKSSEKLGWAMENISEDGFTEATVAAIRHCGSMYASEGEWVVHGDHFKVPPRSVMLVGVDMSIMQSMDKWYNRNPDDMLGFISTQWRYERTEKLLASIEAFHLHDFYQIRFIDSPKFEELRGDLMYRRRIAREKAQAASAGPQSISSG